MAQFMKIDSEVLLGKCVFTESFRLPESNYESTPKALKKGDE